MVKAGYTNAAIPNDLAKRIDRLIARTALGYRSRQEFITEAVRHHVLAMETRSTPPSDPGKN